jgi:hypothetical protein
MRYGGLVVAGSATVVGDTRSAVAECIKTLKAIVQDGDDSTWAAEEPWRK